MGAIPAGHQSQIRGASECFCWGSNAGFPEGDSMSPLAMVVADIVYHRYLQIYAPSVRALSYVDNLSCTAGQVGHLIQEYNLTNCVCNMLGLQLDSQKTFVWSVGSAGRKVLSGLGLQVASSARELGGILSFGCTTRNSELVSRCKQLAPLWLKLKRSRAPAAQKVAVLPLKFWPKALHGIQGCLLAGAHLGQLRAAAVKAIGIHPGGSNALLRLTFAADMTADPGFFQLWNCVTMMRRMLHKVPHLLMEWKYFMTQYDGRLFHGPYSKFLQVLSEVAWAVRDPPLLSDSEGLTYDLIKCPLALFRRRLEQSWLEHVTK